MEYFVGIDPSFNSTGICILKFEEDNKISEDFIILKSTKKLTKREKSAEENIYNFCYQSYEKEDLSKYDSNNHFKEYWKTNNMINLANKIYEVVKDYTKDNPEKIYIIIEGISYGSSIRTKSVFDLAGLNYLIRNKFFNHDNILITIVTPSEVKKFATNNGNCAKDIMVDIFLKKYDMMRIIPKVDDISDAWFLSNYMIYLDNMNVSSKH